MRSDETPHGIDGGGVPLTSEGVTRPRIVAARRPPRSVYSSGFRKRMASPRHDRNSVTKPSRASGYSKSDDRAPSRARGRPPRAVAHQRRTQVVEFAAGMRRGPPRVTSIREGALRRPRRPSKRPDFVVACLVRRTQAQKRCPTRKGMRRDHLPARVLFGAAGAVCGVVLAKPSN